MINKDVSTTHIFSACWGIILRSIYPVKVVLRKHTPDFYVFSQNAAAGKKDFQAYSYAYG